jgi:excisionase family DNA binding protein
VNDSKPKLSIVRPSPTFARPEDLVSKDLVGEVELAARLGVSRSTLQSWRYSGRGPRFIKIGRLVRYRNTDVEAFLAACTQDQCA